MAKTTAVNRDKAKITAKKNTTPKTTPRKSKSNVTQAEKKSRRVPHDVMFNDREYVHDQLDRLIFALEAFREGDISVRLSKERNDKFADLAEAYNTMVEMIGGVSTEVSRISRVGGIEGNLDARAEFKAATGVWKDMIDNINILIEAIAKPVLEVSRILNSIAAGKLEDKFSLTYDILIYPRQLPAAIDLVQRFPQQPFVLDHIAKPDMKAGTREPWAAQLRALAAAHPTLTCKLSGLVTEADWASWKVTDIHPFLDTVLEAFGTQRLMIGSDWPVCTLAADYHRTMGLVEEYLARVPPAAREAILGGTAAAFYGLT
jgi:hypothetical protein